MSLILFLAAMSAQAETKAAIVTRLGEKLMDGHSARYIWPDPWPSDGVVCGKVNAKNSYGGYTGFKRFVAVRDAVGLTVMLEESGGIQSSMVSLHCDNR